MQFVFCQVNKIAYPRCICGVETRLKKFEVCENSCQRELTEIRGRFTPKINRIKASDIFSSTSANFHGHVSAVSYIYTKNYTSHKMRDINVNRFT